MPVASNKKCLWQHFCHHQEHSTEVPLAMDNKKKKKAKPSTLRRNARRREDFLKKKRCPAAVTPISSATASKSVAATNTTRNSDPPAYHHESLVNALLSPGAGGEPVFTELSVEVEVPPNYIPSPPLCSTCFQEWTHSVRGTTSMFATVVVDMPSLSHLPMWLNLRLTDFEACDTTSVATVKAFFSWKIICGCWKE